MKDNQMCVCVCVCVCVRERERERERLETCVQGSCSSVLPVMRVCSCYIVCMWRGGGDKEAEEGASFTQNYSENSDTVPKGRPVVKALFRPGLQFT